MVSMILVMVLYFGRSHTKGRANGPIERIAKTITKVEKYHFVFGN